MAFDALEVTFALLGLVLLNKLGLSVEAQQRAASSQYVHVIVERFNKALAWGANAALVPPARPCLTRRALVTCPSPPLESKQDRPRVRG